LRLLLRITLWRTDPSLASVRDAHALATLPEAEQEAWRKLWADADGLHKQVQSRITETIIQGNLIDRREVHELKLEAGKAYLIDMHSSVLDSHLKLLHPSGKLIAEHEDVAYDNVDARLIFAPPTDGMYRIVATSFREAGRGAYTLTIRAAGRP